MGDTFEEKTPVLRWLAWFEVLPGPLRAHLATHLALKELLPLERAVHDPEEDATIATMLAERTDRAISDAYVRASFTGEAELRRMDIGMRAPDPEIDKHFRKLRDQMTHRSFEWACASESWAQLRRTGLADRRIIRWREKRSRDGDRHA
jgi:hypothetical protein